MKSHLSLLALLLIGLLSFSSCNIACVQGEGEVSNHIIDLDLITGISLETSIDVELKYGPNQKIEVMAHDNHMALLNKHISGGTWAIKFDKNVCSEDISMVITLPLITEISIEGSGDVRSSTPMQSKNLDLSIEGSGELKLDVSAEHIDLDIEGSGDVSLAGNAEDMDVDVSGSGSLEASDLKLNSVDIKINGSGNAAVHAEKTLDASLNGSGSVEYSGSPKVTSKINGSGQVRKN